MKKIIIGSFLIFSMMICLTGCGKVEVKKEDNTTASIHKRVEIPKGIQVLDCNIEENEGGVLVNKIIQVTKNYDTNEFLDGSFIVKLTFDDSATEEEINMLKNVSMCSSGEMGLLFQYGDCNIEFEGKSSISTLTLNVDSINEKNISLEEIKESFKENSSKCTIREKN